MPSDSTRWLKESAVVRALDHLTVIEVRGDDHREWLQGQVTNDVAALREGDTQYTFIVNLKGRVLADAWVLDRGHAFWLVIDADAADAVMARLDKYIIMEDVELERLGVRVLSVQGPKADAVAPKGWPVDRLGAGGRERFVEPSEAESVLAGLTISAEAVGGGPIDARAWEHERLTRGIPRFGLDFGDWTYPQETGLTSRAVSFEKGCYVGQEPVVMLQHRGKAPKRLAQIRHADGSPGLALLKRDLAQPGTRTSVEGAEVEVVQLVGEPPT